jgi:DNA-binding CsgD family transcriptional regulator
VTGPQHHRARTGARPRLTPTEIRVAALAQDGLSNYEIALELSLSRRTVAGHVSDVLKKLGVQSRAEIAGRSALST